MNGAELAPVDSDERGRSIERRRVTLGYTQRQLHELMESRGQGISRGALGRAEKGQASNSTYVRLEVFLDQLEEEMGYAAGEVLASATRASWPNDVQVAADLVAAFLARLDEDLRREGVRQLINWVTEGDPSRSIG